jgi:hypothetical protein
MEIPQINQEVKLVQDAQGVHLQNEFGHIRCPYRSPVQMVEHSNLGAQPKVFLQESICGSWCALFEHAVSGPVTTVTQHCVKRTFACITETPELPKSQLCIT